MLDRQEGYAGDPENCSLFITNCSILFALQTHTYASEEAEVTHTYASEEAEVV